MELLELQRTAGNAAVSGAIASGAISFPPGVVGSPWLGPIQPSHPAAAPPPLARNRLQREITVESNKVLPRAVVELDPRNSRQLVVRFGDDQIATITVSGSNAFVDTIQVRDRTGARNQGGIITDVDVEIVHPPGWLVTLEPIPAALARTKKKIGVGGIKFNTVERRPPYGKDELQLWPPAHQLADIKQRRKLTKDEKDYLERKRKEEIEREQEISRKVAALMKQYQKLQNETEANDEHLMQLYGLGLLYQAAAELPPPTLYNDIRNELFEAVRALDRRNPGSARVRLKRAEKALQKANKAVSTAHNRGIKNLERMAKALGIVSVIGETTARFIPGPLGKLLSFLYEVVKPAPKTLDEAAERLRGAYQTGAGYGPGNAPKKPGVNPPSPDAKPTSKPGSKAGSSPGTPASGSAKTGQAGGGSAAAGKSSQSTAAKVGGDPDKFVASKAAKVAKMPTPKLEEFKGFKLVKTLKGGSQGLNEKYLLVDKKGQQWMFKPADMEEGMWYGSSIGIGRGERYRRAAAAAFMADKLGVDTPDIRLGTWNGRPGSLQKWRPGYETGTELKARNQQQFDQFYNSQQRKDLDALDYVTAQQDRHMGNVMLKDKGGGKFEVLAIDQDAAFPTTKGRFDPNIHPDPKYHRDIYQRPLSKTMSKEMAEKMRRLDANWPEAELRQWLTKAEVDGARFRLTEIITKLAKGEILVVQ